MRGVHPAAPTARVAPAHRGPGRTAELVIAMRADWPTYVAVATLVVALLVLAFNAGGYFPADSNLVACGVYLVLGGLLAAHRPTWTLSPLAITALLALCGLTLWSGLSLSWSSAPDSGTEDFQRLLLYLGLFGLALVAARSGRHSRLLLWTALGLCAVIGGAGLLSRLLPELVQTTEPAGAAYRLSFPLTYWNALGAVSAMGTILALGLAANPRSGPPARGASAALAVLLAVTMSLTLSRASWLALIAGCVALGLLGAHRGSLLLTVSVVAAAAGLAILRLRGYPGLTDGPGLGSGQEAEGREFGLQLLVLAGVAGAAVAALAVGRRSAMVQDAVRRARTPLLYGGGALLATVAVLGYVVRADSVEGRTTNAFSDAGDWISDEWDVFMTPTTFSRGGTERLTTAQGTRSEIYRVALDQFADAPLVGGGVGAFEVAWYAERGLDEDLRDAHSLELEVLADLGIVGALLLATVLGSFGAAIVRTRVKGGAVGRTEAAAAGAACSVWFVHSFVDWDWQMPAVSGLTLLLAAAVLPEGRRSRSAVQRRRRTPTAS